MIGRRAFTLIELLIVVAIIALLAAIAIFNLQAAMIRSRAARATNDLRVIADALEAYIIDFNTYPTAVSLPTNPSTVPRAYVVLTTPVAYLGNNVDSLVDPFLLGDILSGYDTGSYSRYYVLSTGTRADSIRAPRFRYILTSRGPDNRPSIHSFVCIWKENEPPTNFFPQRCSTSHWMAYDPSNGIVSCGDIYRLGGSPMNWHQQLNIGRIAP